MSISSANIKNLCRYCGDSTSNASNVCDDCHDELTFQCSECKEIVDTLERNSYIDIGKNGEYTILCRVCAQKKSMCWACGKLNVPRCDACGVGMCERHTEQHYCGPVFNGLLGRRPSGVFSGDAPTLKSFIKSNRLVGIEIEAVDGNMDKLGMTLPNYCGISGDGSIKGRNPVEIQTPPASASCLESIVMDVCVALQEANYKTNETCGVHIHIDGTGIYNNPEMIVRLVNTYYAVEPIIFGMLPTDRYMNRYALPISNWIGGIRLLDMNKDGKLSLQNMKTQWYKATDINRIRAYQGDRYDSSRYHGFNLHPLFRDAHFELRYHNGTIDAMEILNWIKFNLTLTDWAVNNYRGDVVGNIHREIKFKKKLNLVLKSFGFEKDIKKYIKKRVAKYWKYQ